MKNVIEDNGVEVELNKNDYIDSIIINLRENLSNFKDYLFIKFCELGDRLPISRNFKHDKKVLFWGG